MRIDICDRCQSPIKGAAAKGMVKVRLDDDVDQEQEVELCPACCQGLISWFRGVEVERSRALNDPQAITDLIERVNGKVGEREPASVDA